MGTYEIAPAAPGPSEALALAAQHARRFWMSEAAFRAAVTSVRPVESRVTRALHLIERREIVLHTAPAFGSRPRDVVACPDTTLDPWQADAEALAGDPGGVITCVRCAGTTRATCAACAGRGRTPCATCNGSGHRSVAEGFRACPTCQGRGSSPCMGCYEGGAECSACGAIGRMYARRELVRSELHQVRVAFDGAVVRYGSLGRAEDFDAAPESWPLEFVEDSGMRAPTAGLPADLAPTLAPTTDRTIATRVQVFRQTDHRIEYRTAFGVGSVLARRLGPEFKIESDWRALDLRRRVLESAAVVAPVLVLALAAVARG